MLGGLDGVGCWFFVELILGMFSARIENCGVVIVAQLNRKGGRDKTRRNQFHARSVVDLAGRGTEN